MPEREGSEPSLVCFCCHWCSYSGADLAGVSRMQYPANIRIVRVMCSGRVEPYFVVQAFLHGLDGVLILGCHPGDCHYLTGNYEARNMVAATRRLLDCVGIDNRRLVLDWVSAAEGTRFAEIVTKFTNEVKTLGTLGAAKPTDVAAVNFRLKAAIAAAQGEKLRWVVAKQTEFATKGNRYGEVFSRHELDRMLDGIVADEVMAQQILALLNEEPASVKEVAASLKLPPPQVLRSMLALRRKGLVTLSGVQGSSPMYKRRNVERF